MNIFEQASILKLRFPSIRGPLTVEQLWDLKLTSTTGWDLDNIAKAVNAQLKASAEESFVSTTRRDTSLEISLEILKHIIAEKIAAANASKKAADRKAEREKLLTIIADKNDTTLRSMSVEDLTARLAALSD